MAHDTSLTTKPKPGATRRQVKGEPFVWLSGGATATGILMIIVLLVYVIFEGTRTFWPLDINVYVVGDARFTIVEYYDKDGNPVAGPLEPGQAQNLVERRVDEHGHFFGPDGKPVDKDGDRVTAKAFLPLTAGRFREVAENFRGRHPFIKGPDGLVTRTVGGRELAISAHDYIKDASLAATPYSVYNEKGQRVGLDEAIGRPSVKDYAALMGTVRADRNLDLRDLPRKPDGRTWESFELPQPATEILLRQGNQGRQDQPLYTAAEYFVWLKRDVPDEETYRTDNPAGFQRYVLDSYHPRGVAEIERLEKGVLTGWVVGIYDRGMPVATVRDDGLDGVWTAFEKRLAEMRGVYLKRYDLERNAIGRINYELDERKKEILGIRYNHRKSGEMLAALEKLADAYTDWTRAQPVVAPTEDENKRDGGPEFAVESPLDFAPKAGEEETVGQRGQRLKREKELADEAMTLALAQADALRESGLESIPGEIASPRAKRALDNLRGQPAEQRTRGAILRVAKQLLDQAVHSNPRSSKLGEAEPVLRKIAQEQLKLWRADLEAILNKWQDEVFGYKLDWAQKDALKQARAIQQRRADLHALEYAMLRFEVDYLRARETEVQLKLRTLNGMVATEALAGCTRGFRPNELGLFGKLGVYFDRVHEFLTADPRESNTEGGIFMVILGTLVMTLVMCILVVPFGVIAALYLREYAKQGPLVSTVRIAVNNLAGVPSIVFGMFGLGLFCVTFGKTIDQLFFPALDTTPTFGGGGVLWASLTLALLTVPVVIVATEEALIAVPSSQREASLACGASRFQTIAKVILPQAMPGILTGMILAMARGAGEVAPLMLVGVVKYAPYAPVDSIPPFLHLERKFMHLGFHIYDLGFQSPDAERTKPLVFSTTLVLIALVALLNVFAIRIRNRIRGKLQSSHV